MRFVGTARFTAHFFSIAFRVSSLEGNLVRLQDQLGVDLLCLQLLILDEAWTFGRVFLGPTRRPEHLVHGQAEEGLTVRRVPDVIGVVLRFLTIQWHVLVILLL